MHHDLKIWPQHFVRVMDGSKTFEIRNNDRSFQQGDTVTLKEYRPKQHSFDYMGDQYSGKEASFRIGAVYPIDMGRVVFSLLPTDEKKEG